MDKQLEELEDLRQKVEKADEMYDKCFQSI